MIRRFLRALSRVVRAYPTLLRVGFAGALAYRAEMLIWMLTTTMPLVSLALWSAVAEGAPVGRFGAREFTAYFLVTLIVRQLTSSWIVWEMNADIKSGALSQRLLKPIHPLFGYSAENLAAIPLRAALCVPIAGAAFLFAGDRLPSGLGAFALFALALAGAWLLNFLITALIGALAFVMESSVSVFEVYFAAFMIFSGYMVPLELFPPALRELAMVLPFRYTLAFPVEVGTGLLAPGRWATELAIQWAYIVGVGAVVLWSWRAGLRRFGAFGG